MITLLLLFILACLVIKGMWKEHNTPIQYRSTFSIVIYAVATVYVLLMLLWAEFNIR